MIVYESTELFKFQQQCKARHGCAGLWNDTASEIATDIMWAQGNDMFTWDGETSSFRIICVERSAEEIIEVIDEIIEQYELGDYF